MKAILDDHRVSMTRSLDSTEFSKNHQENKLLHADLRDGEVLVETSRSICSTCLKVMECQIVSRENKVYMRKYCEEHGLFEVLIYSDADDFITAAQYNKPGKKPLHYQSSVAKGCPEDCGLCEAHKGND